MPARLIIRLPADSDAPLRWVAVDAQGRAEASSISGTPETLAHAAQGREPIALVDGLAVLVTRVHVPTRSNTRLNRAVPYALEDHLSTDIDALHFALGPRDAAGNLVVAVVARAQMTAWLERLREAGVPPSRMIPETLALPQSDTTWSLLLEGERFLARTDAAAGFGGDRSNLALLLEAALAEAGAEDATPARLTVYHANHERPELPAGLPETSDEICADATALLAEGVVDTPLDLRQGEFARQHRRLAHWRRWRTPALLLAGALFLATLNAWWQRFALATEAQALQARMGEVFRSAFPDSQIPAGQEVSVMRARLERLRGGGNRDGLIALLNRLAEPLGSATGVKLAALTYRGGGLELELNAESLQQIEQLKQALQGAGTRVEVRSARSDGSGVRGRLTLEPTP